MKKILVPLDGSKVAEEILIYVELLARQSGAHVILMRVVPFLWPSEHVHLKEMGHKMDKEASDYLFTIETHLVEKGIEASVLVDEGNVPEMICDTAKERGVDLIAISTHGHGGIKRWALGSVTAKVIQASSIPLLVHRSTGEQMEEVQCKNMLIPIDGSDFAESIFPQARRVAELFNAKVWFLSVVTLPGGFSFLDEEVSDLEDKVAESIKHYYSTLESRIQEQQTTIDYEVVIRKGETAETICDFANENNIDLIAISTHGRSGISRWALGSVTDKLLQSSQKPILLVRAQEDKD
jgi:nucleotide-binding universal stress UspA family protein